MPSKKIIILGGSGAIGSSIAKELKQKNYAPILISKNKDDIKLIAKKLDCQYYVCDVLNTEKLTKTIQEIRDETHRFTITSQQKKQIKISIKSSGSSVGIISLGPIPPFSRKVDLCIPSIFKSIPDFINLVFSGPKVVFIGR